VLNVGAYTVKKHCEIILGYTSFDSYYDVGLLLVSVRAKEPKRVIL
jgi:hypothetical protein